MMAPSLLQVEDETLEARQVPFAFATGYGNPVARSTFAAVPILIKPVGLDLLKRMLDSLSSKR